MQNNPPSSTRRVRPARESKSATVRAAAAAPSRRQLSHWQREQHQRRLLYIGVGALVVVVAAIFAAGLIYDNVYRANQVVAQVGPDSITATQLLDEIRPQARALDAQAKQVGGGTSSDQIASYLDSQKRALPDSVLNDLIDTHIVQQEATRRGISVTPAEVDDKERQTIAEFQASKNPAPTPAPTEAPEASPTAAITSATPELTVLPVAAALTPTALTTPTAVPTLEADAYTTALQQFVTQNNVTEADLRTQIERSLLQDKIQAAIGQEQVPDTQAQVHARQIVVATSDQANDLLNQLKNGADFAQLAQQNSTDTVTRDKGGDMGWFARGVQTKAIEDAAFSLQPGQLSDVISDGGSYHILQVIESDPNRSLPPDQLTNQRQKAFQDWLSSKRSGQDVKLSLDQSQKDWLLARIGVRP
jgi:parvulin-like peptidyl-prolyl isomerase